MRMKQFALDFLDIEHKLPWGFILGLNKKIHRTIELIVPTTYVTALRAKKSNGRRGWISRTPSTYYYCGIEANS